MTVQPKIRDLSAARQIPMSGQHLAMCIDLDAEALCLLKKRIQVVKVVAGDEDGFALASIEPDLRRHRVTESIRVGLIQNFHHAIIQLADRESIGKQLLGRGRWLGQEVEKLVDLAE